jgi:hypothetical protein
MDEPKMNKDDIICMAREAGMEVVDDQFSLLPFLERFFHMAQAAEREACAKVCEENADDDTEGDWDSACISCANHIRARGQA